MRRAHRLLAGLLATGALLTATAGCAQSVDPIERLGRKAAQKVSRQHRTPEPEPGPTSGAEPERREGVRGDQGAAGSTVVGPCGRPGRLPETGPTGSFSPLRHWWPDGPEPSGGAGAGTGCERR
ncbi:hypothetical protein ACFU6I_22420 [Streptomyces sp. NPDC057486]|uniref:hypothetical protein n=1 Tax=Streptomyces sp. NPDC057486 TaxID=3346145 RepID=UPI0036C03AB2